MNFDEVNQGSEPFPITSLKISRVLFPQSFKDPIGEAPRDSEGIQSSFSGSVHPDLELDKGEEGGREGDYDLRVLCE